MAGRLLGVPKVRMGEIQSAYMNKRRPFKPIIYFIAFAFSLLNQT